MPLDEDALTSALADAARAAFSQLRADHPDERFYCYGLYTTAEYKWVSPLVLGERGLADIAGDDPDQRSELRWSPADSPYMEEGEEHFDKAQSILDALPHIYDLPHDEFVSRVAQVRRCCFGALKALDADGFFGSGVERDRVVLNIFQGDQSNRSRLDNARALNPASALDQIIADMPVTVEVGTFEPLGDPMYQVDDLSVCGDVIAAVGGKRALVWRGRELVIDAELPGNAWAVAAGDRSVVTHADGDVIVLALDGSPAAQLPRHENRVGSLAVSRDGRLVISAGWGSALIAVRDGDELWRSDASVEGIALSADETRLYVASDGVAILDVDTGERRGRLGGAMPLSCVAVASTGAVAAGSSSVSAPGRLALWDAGGALIAQPAIPDLLPESAKYGTYRPTGVAAVAFSPGGARFASAHDSGELHVWDVATGERVTTVRGRHEALSSCAWVDDDHVALAGRDVDHSPAVLIFAV